MGELDFGIAMLKAKSAVKERFLLGKRLKGSSTKLRPHGKKEFGKRIHLIVGSLLKNHPGDKILLPSDKEIESFRSGGMLLKR